MTKKNKVTELALIVSVSAIVTMLMLGGIMLMSKISVSTDEQTDKLCREYAKGRPWTALTKERIEFLGQEYLENFDYYTSCIINIKNPIKK